MNRHIASLPAGLTLSEVAKRLKVSYTTASRVCSGYGYVCKRKETPSLIPRIKELIRKGLPNIEIARAVSVSREHVRRIRLDLKAPKVENRGRKTGISPYRKNGKKHS